ncbi:MAG: SIMPL domain-containing protein [Thermovirgaceae bacterium]
MERKEIKDRKDRGITGGLMFLGFFLAFGMIVSAFLVAGTVEKVKLSNQTITVKGFAQKLVTSDVATWSGQITVRAAELVEASGKLEADRDKVLEYFRVHGVPEEQLALSGVDTFPRYKRTQEGRETNEIDHYQLQQTVTLSSDDVRLVEQLARSSSGLLGEGVEFFAYAPQYFYSGLEAAKIELLGEATKNARERAKQLAEGSGGQVGKLRSASQGVFQITQPYSTDVEDYGMYDTTTIEKAIKAVVTIQYTIR